MKKGLVLLVVGLILVIAAIGIYVVYSHGAVSGTRELHIGANETKELSFNLKDGDYFLVMVSEGKVNYTFLDENDTVMKSGEVEKQLSQDLGHLKGNYTLRITNLESQSVKVTVLLKSSESLISMGTGVLASGGVCLVGIILIIVGIVLALKHRKQEGEMRVS